MLRAHAGAAVGVSPLLFAALEVAYEVAGRTHGAVDPTVGNTIAALDYDRDLSEVKADPPYPAQALDSVAGFLDLHLNPANRTVDIPRVVWTLDLRRRHWPSTGQPIASLHNMNLAYW